MIWADLAIISVCLWGGVTGYFKGICKMAVKITFLAGAIVVANVFKKHVSVYLTIVFDFEYKIKEVIFKEFVIPVFGIIDNFNGDHLRENINKFMENMSLPVLIEKNIMERLEEMPGTGDELIFFVDMLANLFINVTSFFLAFLLWAGYLYVVETIVIERHWVRPGDQSCADCSRGCLKNGRKGIGK